MAENSSTRWRRSLTRKRNAFRRARICLLFTPSLCRRDPWRTLVEAVRAGVDVVQVREKRATSRELLALTLEVKRRVGNRALVFVNDRADIAFLSGADGVHLGQDDLPLREARAILGSRGLIGISTHDMAQVREAWKNGADGIGFGPIFPTATKGYSRGLGVRATLGLPRNRAGPVFLIGGIRPDRIAKLPPGLGVAVCTAVLQAKNPGLAVKKMLAALR